MEVDQWNDLDFADPDLQRLLDGHSPNEQAAQAEPPPKEFNDFDRTNGDTWIYPDNLPCRAYQQSISQSALFKNTLVVLPTGLGKTFIAAVVMYNIYRWYPKGKVIFLAPTRPLVAQQINACKNIMPLPSNDTVELTGKLPRHKRFELWRTKRVFFATPQSVQSDIIGSGHDVINDFPFQHIRLLVIDEAHKAKGRFAYTEVTQAIWQRNRNFRVLALSATPGRSVDDVAEVIRNLFISHLEVRWDNSIDVMPYVHHRSIKTIVVKLGEQINKVRQELITIIDPYERQLIEAGVINGSCANISRNFLLFEQKRFRERSLHQSFTNQSSINSNFSICVSLYHALELLERHGLRVFVNYFEQDEDGRTKFIYSMDGKLRNLIEKLRCNLGPNPFDTSISAMTNGQIAPMPSNLDFGHPKFEHARNCLLKHFEENPTSRAIVFCEYRESVLLVYRMLLQHVPVLQPRCFAGHSGSGPLRALTQKQQIQIMNDFREGKSNILVATCIGEEGIDVGEVEMIVCFDISTANPTRFIQRIGRTGRKKKGNVVMLVTEGREQRLLKDVMAKKDQTNKKILHSPLIRSILYKNSPRLVPADLSPICLKQFVQPLEQRDKDEKVSSPKKPTKVTRKGKKTQEDILVTKSSQDLRNFFKNKENVKKLTKITVSKTTSAAASSQAAAAAATTTTTTIDIIDLDEDDDFDAFALNAGPGVETQKAFEKSFKERFPEVDFSDICTKSNTQLLGSTSSQTRDIKYLKKVNKLLQNFAPIVPESRRKCDLLTNLKSKNLTKVSKMLLLRNNMQFVSDLCKNIEVLDAVPIEYKQVDLDVISKKEIELRDCYNLVLDILGGKHGLMEFLAKYSKYESLVNRPSEKYVDNFLFNNDDFKDCMQNIFERFGKPQFNRDNYEFIHDKFKKTESYQRLMEKENNGIIDEGSMTEKVDILLDPTIIDLEEITDVESESSTDVKWQETTTTNSTNFTTFESRLEKDLEIISKSFSEFEATILPNKNEMEDDSIINCSMDDNDSRYLTAWEEFSKRANLDTNKSTPLNKSKLKKPIDFSTISNEYAKENRKQHINNETPDIIPELYLTAKPTNHIKPISSIKTSTTQLFQSSVSTTIGDELDFDMDLFLEPFPEEESYTAGRTGNIKSQKENIVSENLLERNSPDLFDSSDKQSTPFKAPEINNSKKPTLSSKLAQKCFLESKMKEKSPLKTPPNKVATSTANNKYHTSPSIFESYLQKVQMHKAKKIDGSKSNVISSSLQNVTKRKRPTPRKLTLSPVHNGVSGNSSDSDFEEIAPTQQVSLSHVLRQRKKRRLCGFIDDEVIVSGSDCSSDDAEETIGQYMLDSVVVHDDAVDESQASRSHMQAMYMQSVKSPKQRPGAFKIPRYKSFNDHSQIFSQDMDDVGPSQYVPDSFVVDEDTTESMWPSPDETLCPLERAEMILKQRRKARKLQVQGAKSPTKRKPKRKVYTMSDSSENDQ